MPRKNKRRACIRRHRGRRRRRCRWPSGGFDPVGTLLGAAEDVGGGLAVAGSTAYQVGRGGVGVVGATVSGGLDAATHPVRTAKASWANPTAPITGTVDGLTACFRNGTAYSCGASITEGALLAF